MQIKKKVKKSEMPFDVFTKDKRASATIIVANADKPTATIFVCCNVKKYFFRVAIKIPFTYNCRILE